MSIVQFLTQQDIATLRSALLSEVGLTLTELRARRDAGSLDLNAQGVLDELEDLEYLARDDAK